MKTQMKTQTGFTFLTTLIGLPIFLGILLLGSVPSWAATITVNSPLDNTTQDGYCTLREAIDNAQQDASHADCLPGTGGGNDIIFNMTTPATINLTGALPIIRRSINLLNQTGNRLTVRRATGGDYRIFTVVGVTVTIEGLTIEKGLVPDLDSGGGVYNMGTLTLKNTTIRGNQASSGAGIYNSGGILELIQSTVSDNSISSASTSDFLVGAGIHNRGGKCTITNSTISGNSTPATPANASALVGGAGLYNDAFGTVEIINSTISHNLIFSTLGTGGGLANDDLFSGGLMTVKNTIIADNFASLGLGADVAGNITGNNHNLISKSDLFTNIGTVGTGTDKIISVSSLRLGPLQDNGGLVNTHALLSGSPAINAGNNALAAGFKFDQRCAPRMEGTVDIGAVEVITQSPTYSYNFGATTTFSVPEGNDTHTVSNAVVISRSGADLSQSSSVDIVSTGSSTATAGVDFTAGSLTVQFNPCQENKAVTVPIEIRGNTVLEGDKIVVLSLANFSSGGSVGGTQPTATLTITNDDATGPSLPTYSYDFGAATFTVPEGNDTHSVSDVVVKRSGADLSLASSVDVVLTGTTTASAGVDFTAGSLTVQFSPRQDTQVVPIEIRGNTVLEGDKTVVLSLANFSGGGSVGGTQPTATLIITNDDATTESPPPLPIPTPIPTPAPTPPTPLPPPAGFSSTPAPSSPVMFDNTLVGATSTQNLLIKNTGGTSLIINNLTGITGPNKYDFQVLSPSFPLIIYPGDPEQTVTVQCNPHLTTGLGLRIATLELSSTDPKYLTVSYPLQCIGIKAGYSSRPKAGSVLKFGSSEIGQSVKFEIAIDNNGNANLEVNLDTLSGTNAGDFQVLSPPLPVTIAEGGAAQTVTVQCSPTAEGIRKATLKLRSNDSNILTPTYWLECTGLPAPPPVDVPTPPGGAANPELYTLTATTQGNGTVTLDEYNCGTGCTKSYPSGTLVTLKAVPGEGWQFESWQDDCGSNGTVIMSNNRTCRAIFSPLPPPPPPEPTLTISVEGSGKVALNEVACGTGCQQNYPKDTMVTLQALPNEGWQFSGWQGDCDSNGTVIMSDNHTCQAIFSLLPVATPPPPSPEPTLTISVEGSGKVILDNQIECGTSCQRSYPQDSMVTLRATPNEGWQFESWQGECGNNGAVTMNSDHVCTAKFSAIPIFYKLSVSLAGREGEEGGKIVSWPVGIDCGTKCNASYLNNTVVSLAATPNNGWRLVGWQGDCNESGQVTMNSDHTCIAMFSPINRTLTITVSGSGKVNTPNAVECDKVCTDSYANGTSIVLTATPELGAKFASWGGDCDSNGNVTLDKDRLCVATFVTEDSDGDSISDDEEAGAPNNGDGNNDGTPDKTQSNVASLKDPQNGNYVTLEVNNKECNLQEIQKKVEAQSGQAFTPANLQLDKVKDLSAQAFNPASFQLDKILDDKCQQTDVTLFYYGDNNSFKEAYDKYGPKAPSFLLSQGVTQLPDIIFDTEVINGQPVTKLRANFKKEVAKGVATEKKGTMLFEKSTTVDENVGKVDISVVRKDDATGELCIEYGAYDNTAKLNQDYRVLGIAVSCKDHPKDGQGCFDQKPLCWADGELGKKNFVIEIIDNAIPSEADKKLILSIGKPSQAVNIENAVADLIIVDDDLSACPPNVKISPDLKCQANGQTITEPVNLPEGSRLENAIFNDTVVIHSGSRVDGGTFEGEVINQGMIEHAEFKSNVQNSGGRITNATIAAGVTITGGTLAGHIDNQGVLGGDLWLDDVVIEGGELQCIIMGSGTLQNVHISSLPYCDAYVSGFKLTGAIRGDVDKPLLLENVEILPGSHLINVILGENIILPEDVTLKNVIFSANFHLTGGILRGNITGERKAPALLENVRVSAGCHLTDVTLGKKVTVAKGITLGGSITNQGGSLLEDVQLEGNTVLSGGQIKGKITGKVALNKGVENQALALLKNLEVLTGSHLKDVAIGENVILAVDVILENVKLPANFVMKGGQLRGIIIGQEDAPARLENVKIAAGSYLESVIIGNNVTLAENVRFGKNVCLGAWGIDALGQAVNTQTCFIGHLIADDLSSSSPVMLSNQDVKNVKVSSTIKIDPDHVGQAAEIVIWVEYNTSLVTGKPQKYARDDLGRWSLWVDDDPSKLPTASVYERLPEEIQEVLIYEGGLSTIAGEFTVYVGYRLSDGTLIYNGSNPIDAVVGNSASIDLKQGFRSVTSNAAKKTSYFMPVVENETGQIGNHLTFAQADTLKVLAKARVDAHDVGKPADILMVAVYRHNVEQVMFTRIGEKWQRWDETLESLQPAQSVKELPEILEVPVYQGSLKGMSGEFIVYVGYRLEEGVIVFNGGEPIHVMLVEQE